VINNLYAGAGNLLVGAGFAKGNLAANSGDFRDMKGGDYRLDKRSKAIQAGVPPGIAADGYSLTPTHEYQHNATSRPSRFPPSGHRCPGGGIVHPGLKALPKTT
jgi:hypothetical protein